MNSGKKAKTDLRKSWLDENMAAVTDDAPLELFCEIVRACCYADRSQRAGEPVHIPLKDWGERTHIEVAALQRLGLLKSSTFADVALALVVPAEFVQLALDGVPSLYTYLG